MRSEPNDITRRATATEAQDEAVTGGRKHGGYRLLSSPLGPLYMDDQAVLSVDILPAHALPPKQEYPNESVSQQYEHQAQEDGVNSKKGLKPSLAERLAFCPRATLLKFVTHRSSSFVTCSHRDLPRLTSHSFFRNRERQQRFRQRQKVRGNPVVLSSLVPCLAY